MDKLKYELEQRVAQNLLGFLLRVNLNGSEVHAFNEVVAAIKQPLPVEKQNNKHEDGRAAKAGDKASGADE